MNIPEMAEEQPEKRIHLERYEYATQKLKAKKVLDCACGVGYGTAMLKSTCDPTGIDIDPIAISLAHQNHNLSCCCFVGDIQSTDFSSYDALVSFETLEHLDDPKAIIEKLPPNITEIIASVPIRPTVGWNPWHRSDFTKESFRDLIRSRFEIINEFGQMWIDGADLYLVVHGRRTLC